MTSEKLQAIIERWTTGDMAGSFDDVQELLAEVDRLRAARDAANAIIASDRESMSRSQAVLAKVMTERDAARVEVDRLRDVVHQRDSEIERLCKALDLHTFGR